MMDSNPGLTYCILSYDVLESGYAFVNQVWHSCIVKWSHFKKLKIDLDLDVTWLTTFLWSRDFNLWTDLLCDIVAAFYAYTPWNCIANYTLHLRHSIRSWIRLLNANIIYIFVVMFIENILMVISTIHSYSGAAWRLRLELLSAVCWTLRAVRRSHVASLQRDRM